MKYTEKNGFKVSEITLGTVQLGLSYGINNTHGQPSEKEAFEILDAAGEMGITAFDTARAYGNSEDVLGHYFKDKESPVFITKIGRNEDVDISKIYDEYVSECAASIKALGVECLPFAKLHTERMITRYGDKVLYALEKVKKEGYVKNIGVSFSDKTNLLDYSDPSVFDCIQIPLNLFDCKEAMDGSLKKIEDSGIIVFIRSVYLQGLFFKDVNTLPEKLVCAKDSILKIRELAAQNEMSVTEMAMAFIKETEGVTSIITGCETAEQLRESVSIHQNSTLSDSIRKEIIKIASEVPDIVTRPWDWNK